MNIFKFKSIFEFSIQDNNKRFFFELQFDLPLNMRDSRRLDKQLSLPIEVSFPEGNVKPQDFIFVLGNLQTTLTMARPRRGVFKIEPLAKGSYIIRIYSNEEWLASIPFVITEDRFGF